MPVKIFTKIFPGWTGGNYIDIKPSVVPPGTYLLDQYPGATLAYSVRKLRSAYTGYAFEVRRDSDSATADIGFVGEDLDDTALLAFLGGSKGYVTKWYNQAASPIANTTLQQSAALSQPEIVLDSGKYSLHFVHTVPQYLLTTGASPPVVINPNGSFTTFAVARTQLNNILQVVFQQDQGNTQRIGQFTRFNASANSQTIGFVGSFSPIVHTGPAYNVGTQYMFTTVRKTTSLQLFLNGASNAATASAGAGYSTTGIGNITVGRRLNSEAFEGDTPEIILYPADESADRVAIETNIRTYYGF